MIKWIQGFRGRCRQLYMLAAAFVLSTIAPSAMAFTAPTAGDFAYDVYDIVVNSMLGGPIGFIGAIALIVWGATKVMTNWMITVLCVISGTIIIKADALVATLGATI